MPGRQDTNVGLVKKIDSSEVQHVASTHKLPATLVDTLGSLFANTRHWVLKSDYLLKETLDETLESLITSFETLCSSRLRSHAKGYGAQKRVLKRTTKTLTSVFFQCLPCRPVDILNSLNSRPFTRQLFLWILAFELLTLVRPFDLQELDNEDVLNVFDYHLQLRVCPPSKSSNCHLINLLKYIIKEGFKEDLLDQLSLRCSGKFANLLTVEESSALILWYLEEEETSNQKDFINSCANNLLNNLSIWNERLTPVPDTLRVVDFIIKRSENQVLTSELNFLSRVLFESVLLQKNKDCLVRSIKNFPWRRVPETEKLFFNSQLPHMNYFSEVDLKEIEKATKQGRGIPRCQGGWTTSESDRAEAPFACGNTESAIHPNDVKAFDCEYKWRNARSCVGSHPLVGVISEHGILSGGSGSSWFSPQSPGEFCFSCDLETGAVWVEWGGSDSSSRIRRKSEQSGPPMRNDRFLLSSSFSFFTMTRPIRIVVDRQHNRFLCFVPDSLYPFELKVPALSWPSKLFPAVRCSSGFFEGYFSTPHPMFSEAIDEYCAMQFSDNDHGDDPPLLAPLFSLFWDQVKEEAFKSAAITPRQNSKPSLWRRMAGAACTGTRTYLKQRQRRQPPTRFLPSRSSIVVSRRLATARRGSGAALFRSLSSLCAETASDRMVRKRLSIRESDFDDDDASFTRKRKRRCSCPA